MSFFDIFKREQPKNQRKKHLSSERTRGNVVPAETAPEKTFVKHGQIFKLVSDECITIGHMLGVNCYNSSGELLLKKGWIIKSEEKFQSMLARGLYIVEGEELTASSDKDKPKKKPVDEKAEKPVTPEQPFEYIEMIRNSLITLFAPVISGLVTESQIKSNVFSAETYKIAESIQNLCLLAPDAAIGAMHLTPAKRYTISQPVNRAILCEMICSRKKISAEARKVVIAAALTCDLSIFDLQENLFQQRAPLSTSQKEAIAYHPQETVNLLKSLGVDNNDWLNAVQQHHERIDGKGYPQGLPGSRICLAAKLMFMADSYGALVAPRTYRKPIAPINSVRKIFLKSGKEYDEEFAIALVREMGIYPAGSFVRLQNGETAVVIKRGKTLPTPVVKSVLNPNGVRITRPIRRFTETNAFSIFEAIARNTQLEIDFPGLWEL